MGGSGQNFMARHFWILFGSIWFAVGLPFLIIGLTMWWQSSRFSQEGIQAEGVVIGREVVPASNNRGTRYSVRYRFRARDGGDHEDREDVDVKLWEGLREGGPVRIEYLPADPASSRILGSADWFGAVIFAGLGGFFTFAGAGLIVFSLIGGSRRRRLRRTGTPVEGVVVSSQPTNFSINRVPQWRIRYRYRDLYGVEHEGRSGFLPPSVGSGWREGDTGQVKFDPQKPEKSIWLGHGVDDS